MEPTTEEKPKRKKLSAGDLRQMAGPLADFDPITLLSQDIREALSSLTAKEARYAVDTYYAVQEFRKAAYNQVRSMVDGKPEEPHRLTAWLAYRFETLETRIKQALDLWSDNERIGQWAKSIVGIGPVISAGLLAYIDINHAPTVSHIYRFAGLDPNQKWLGKTELPRLVNKIMVGDVDLITAVSRVAAELGRTPERLLALATKDREGNTVPLTKDRLIAAASKRPWNAGLKVLCFKIGDSFTKVQANADDFYGTKYAFRKEQEWSLNLSGKLADQASKALDAKDIRATYTRNWYEGKYDPKVVREYLNQGKQSEMLSLPIATNGHGVPMLPPAHIHARAKRFAVKLFLSHYWEVLYWLHHKKEPPKPYAIQHLGHADYIAPPNFEPPDRIVESTKRTVSRRNQYV
jgi:hypothetical protein